MTTTSTKTTPAYLAFVAALQARTDIQATELAGYICFQHPVSQHKVYVPKSVKTVKPVHTTLPLDSSTPGYISLPKSNGKIHCMMVPDLELVSDLIASLGGQGTLRPAARQPKQVVSTPTYSEQDFKDEAALYQTVSA